MSATPKRDRPLSPHIGIYRMSRYSLLSSITNRITGVILSAGLLPLVYWLTAAASGRRAYARAASLLGSAPLRVFYALLLFAFCYHLTAGIRHLVWDTGRGMERAQSMRSAALVGAISLALALALCAWLFLLRDAGAP
jgi:succinate dehydrogenase / fumarate reductase, cytochrome b subunit